MAEAEAVDGTTAAEAEAAGVDASVVAHQRNTTPAGDGKLKVGAHQHPYRIYDGVVQYQLKDGTWKDAPESAERV